MFEIRKIEFLEGLYATSDGRILDSEFNEVNKWIHRGYYTIWCNGKAWLIHRVIAQVFIPNPQNKCEVHHINLNKLDNGVENLVWLSREEHTALHMKGNMNMLGKHHSEETKRKLSEINKGENSYWYGKHHTEETKRKMSETKSKQVYQYTLDKELVAIYPSTMEAARNGYNQGHIAECCRGERKTHKGFIWSYTPISIN